MVTREFGRIGMYSGTVGVRESDDAMRLLTRFTDRVDTAYGGGFVESVDGFESTSSGSSRSDWFFYLDGSESPVGALEAEVPPGSTLWWDRREWSAATHVPEVVGSWPRPFGSGVEFSVECLGSRRSLCSGISRDLEGTGAVLDHGASSERSPLRVLVGPWEEIRTDPTAALVERGPGTSGVYARFVARGGSWSLQPLDSFGRPAGRPGPGGLVAAVRSDSGGVVWLVTGTDASAVPERLVGKDLIRRYSVLFGRDREDSATTGLPLE